MERDPKGGIVFCSNSTSGNFRDHSKRTKMYQQKWGSVTFMKKVLSNTWLIIAMLFRVEILSVFVWPKN